MVLLGYDAVSQSFSRSQRCCLSQLNTQWCPDRFPAWPCCPVIAPKNHQGLNAPLMWRKRLCSLPQQQQITEQNHLSTSSSQTSKLHQHLQFYTYREHLGVLFSSLNYLHFLFRLCWKNTTNTVSQWKQLPLSSSSIFPNISLLHNHAKNVAHHLWPVFFNLLLPMFSI